jgi:hypothetical protein
MAAYGGPAPGPERESAEPPESPVFGAAENAPENALF